MMGIARTWYSPEVASRLPISIRPIVFASILCLLSGCASAPDNFYRLSADGELPAVRGAGGGALSIGLGPVKIPDYIDRAELVFESAANRFEIPSDHRWAGSLGKSVTSVLAADLGHRLETPAVYAYPWDPGVALRYSVPVRVRQFHAVSGGDAILDVSWEVRDAASGDTLQRGSELFREALTEEGYDGVVAAQSRLLGQLADAVADQLR